MDLRKEFDCLLHCLLICNLYAYAVGRNACKVIETVSPEGSFCDTVQVPYSAGDIELN